MESAEAEAIYEQGREVVVGVLVALSQRVAAQDARIERLAASVEELGRRLNRNSRNSSSPPSQDPPGAPERKRASSAGRSQGAQPGHPGHGRPLTPIESVDAVIDHWPERCGCGHAFSGVEREPVGESARRQVSELPEIAVVVTEHRLHRLHCPDCGATARAELPAEVPTGAFGPRLEAAISALSVRNRVSRRDVSELTEELFGVRVATGTVDAIVQRAGAALAEPYQELLDHVRSAPAVNVDETGWRLRGGKRTLWGAFTPRAALLRVAPDRHERELFALLGEELAGIACSDRWWAYNAFEPERRQVCWSHLLRDFTAHAEGSAAQKDFGEAGLRAAERLFAAWQQFRQDGDRPALKRAIAPLKRELRALLETHARKRARHQAHPHLRQRTCSRSGRRCGPSASSTVSSRPTTTPSAASGARSSTASSRSAASPRKASARSNGCCPSPRPAACSAARSLPTSSTCSPPGHAAIPSRCSSERGSGD